MKPSQAESVFRTRLGEIDEDITPRRAMDAMLAFYSQQRADNVVIEDDGDMLLYEWGLFSFSGPESFQLGLTRQFIETDEDEPYQLRLTLHFVPTDSLRRLKGGSNWCHSPEELPAFRQFVEDSEAFRAIADSKPSRVEVCFDRC